MRILIITQWFPPEPAKLLLELAESLQALGHEVEVLTGFPNYPSGRIHPGYTLRPWARETMHGVRVTRVWLWPEHSRSSLRRIVNYLSFAVSAALLAPLLVRKPDAVFVYGSPYTSAIPARMLKLLWRRPYVFNVQDLWPETLAPTGMATPLMLRGIRRYARWVYRHAARIVAISNGFAERIRAAGVPEEKVRVVSNWVDVDHYRPVPRDVELRRQLGIGDELVVMYAGAMGTPQALGTVLDAAALLRERTDIRFVFFGDGTERAALEEKGRRLGLTQIAFPGRVPESEMPRYYGVGDVLLVHLSSDPLFDMTVPHKIFSYLAVGKPVLAAIGSEARAVVESAGAGIGCPPGDAQAIADAVVRLAAMTAGEREALGANGRRAAVERYSREQLVGRHAEVLAEAARLPRGGARG